MTGFWTCSGMQLRKGYEYFRIPIMPGFCVCKRCTRPWICLNVAEQCPITGFWICLVSVSNKPPVLNMLGLRIWQGCEYARVTHRAEYAWISLNMPYGWTCLSNSEYYWICVCVHIPEKKTECRICQNSECVWCCT